MRTIGEFQRAWAAKVGEPQTPPIRRLPVPSPSPSRPRPRRRLRLGDSIEFQRCRCGSAWFTVRPGKGPHAAQLRCDGCNKFGRWIGQHELGETA
jgi:hypothetical protein